MYPIFCKKYVLVCWLYLSNLAVPVLQYITAIQGGISASSTISTLEEEENLHRTNLTNFYNCPVN